ncbi:hypothetical protein [Streptomyces sp. NPDC054804]
MDQLASAAPEHGATFLGEDLVGWRVAIVAALIAAVVYEMTMALTRMVTLRLPFLVLHLARLSTPKSEWVILYPAWKAELWFILKNREKLRIVRFFNGLRFAFPLAFGGARATARADAEPRRTIRDQLAAGREIAADALTESVAFVSRHKIDRAALTNVFVYWTWEDMGSAFLKTVVVLLCISTSMFSLLSVLALREMRREYRKHRALGSAEATAAGNERRHSGHGG